MLHALEGDTTKLISMSANGRPVPPLSPQQAGMVACGSGNPMACFICVAIWCPLCMYTCCDAWSWGCIPCGTLP